GLLHLPEMRLLEVRRTFRGEDLKRGQAQIAHIAHRPAITTVGLDVTGDSRAPTLQAHLELPERDPARGRALNRRRSELKGSGGRDADGSVLVDEEVLCFSRPRHQLAVEADPSRVERFPEAGRRECLLNDVEQFPLELAGWKHRPARPRVADADAGTWGLAESIDCSLLIAADHDHRPRSHVLFLAHDRCQTVLAVIGESFVGMLERSWSR